MGGEEGGRTWAMGKVCTYVSVCVSNGDKEKRIERDVSGNHHFLRGLVPNDGRCTHFVPGSRVFWTSCDIPGW